MNRFYCHFQQCMCQTQVCWLFKGFSRLIRFQSYESRFPFESYPPFGYLIVLLCETGSSFCILSCLSPLICLAIGSCWTIITFMTDIMHDLSRMNRACKVVPQVAWELKKRFYDVIQLYSEVKQLSENFALFLFKIRSNCNKLLRFYLDLSANSTILRSI